MLAIDAVIAEVKKQSKPEKIAQVATISARQRNWQHPF